MTFKNKQLFMMKKRTFLLMLTLICIGLIPILNFSLSFTNWPEKLMSINNDSNENEQTQRISTELQFKPRKNFSKEEHWKTIAFGTNYAGRKIWPKVFKRYFRNQCEEKRCVFNFNNTSIDNADAVIFNGPDASRSKITTTGHRRTDQIYVFYTVEAPTRFSNGGLKRYTNFFNWTMTYRRDSDVVMPYGGVYKNKNKKSVNYVTQEELQKKKMAIWMVSHCNTQSGRDEFVEILKRYITVDQFGSCGKKKCGEHVTLPKIDNLGDDPCDVAMTNYAFYLALENSLCDDYVSEKLYRALLFGMVPVVLGGANYTSFAPPNSYIDARNFSSIADLANHLKRVAADSRLYNAYLQWQEDYDIELGSPYSPFVCDLCKKLHQQSDNSVHKSYSSIHDWHSMKKTCYNMTYL